MQADALTMHRLALTMHRLAFLMQTDAFLMQTDALTMQGVLPFLALLSGNMNLYHAEAQSRTRVRVEKS
jgi:hypothetical protein